MLSKALSSGMDSEVSKLYKQKSKSLVCSSFINTTVREQRPRSHHKGATGRVQSKKSKEKSLWDTGRCHCLRNLRKRASGILADVTWDGKVGLGYARIRFL